MDSEPEPIRGAMAAALAKLRAWPLSRAATETTPTTTTLPRSEGEWKPRRDLPPGVTGKTSSAGILEPMRSRIIAAIEAKRFPLLLIGQTGRGKSCSAACIYRAWKATARWYRTDEITDKILTARFKGTVTEYVADGSVVTMTEAALLKRIQDTSLIVLDDFGRTKLDDRHRGVLTDILDVRVDRPLIVTLNASADPNSAAYLVKVIRGVADDRIASRLLAGGPKAVIEFTGADRRLSP